MARIKQSADGHGSLKDIQLLVNYNANILNLKITEVLPELENKKIFWLSPLKVDDFAEYRDEEFIELLGLNRHEINLHDFWPKRGPQWDALATTSDGDIILVEAKANIPELVTPSTQAGDESKTLINSSLNETQDYLGIKNNNDWTGTFYQYTNRIAHLYFLRVLKNLPAFLVNIYFTNDESVSGPKTEIEWRAAIKVVKSYFGISRHKLSKYSGDIFIDVGNLNEC